MSTVEQAANPFWLSGNYAPVLDEITAVDLPVTGSVPSDLQGLYVRNGRRAVGRAIGSSATACSTACG